MPELFASMRNDIHDRHESIPSLGSPLLEPNCAMPVYLEAYGRLSTISVESYDNRAIPHCLRMGKAMATPSRCQYKYRVENLMQPQQTLCATCCVPK